MHIVFILETLTHGGAEIFVLGLARALSDAGIPVSLVVLRGNLVDSDLLTGAISSFSRVHLIHSTVLSLSDKLTSLFRRLGLGYDLATYLRSIQLKKILITYDKPVLHSHLFSSDKVVRRTNSSLKLPWLLTIHGDYLRFLSSFPYPFLSASAYRREIDLIDSAAHIVFITSDQLQRLSSTFPSSRSSTRYSLIRNGAYPPDITPPGSLSLRERLSIPDDSFVVSFVARGIREKGWLELIDAFNESNLSNSWLLCAGTSSFVDSLSRRNQNPFIVFLGYQSDPSEVYQASSVSVLPSYYKSESLPTVVIESLFCSTPVLATSIGDVEWMLDINTSHPAGLCVPACEGSQLVSELTASLQALHASPTLLKTLSSNCLSASEKFRMSDCVNAYVSLYNYLSSSRD